ncbi:MAG: type II toxin-antitoxin system death-on-curing family toxin [Oscillospiraceae bacterium]|jgi:death-on-curing protein|nr:type II toxin-antitoxin system death-on-curing family toxin [Oscillospiraceae bacterium]
MILLTADEIIMLHEKLLAATGGLPGLRDRGLLESAVFSVDASFEEVEQYPTVEEKAARLAYALISNHAFADGNKRVGILAMLVTLRLNAVSLNYTQKELIDLGICIAVGEGKYEEIVNWIEAHEKERGSEA